MVLPENSQLIKRVLFPTEVLPITKVVSHGVHFVLALPILILSLFFTGHLRPMILLLIIPIVLQFLFLSGLSLLLASLSVHFRDLRDLMQNVVTLWFFATPIIYTLAMIDIPWLKTAIRLNPATSLFLLYQDVTFFHRFPAPVDLAVAVGVSLLTFAVGAALFDRLRETLMEEA